MDAENWNTDDQTLASNLPRNITSVSGLDEDERLRAAAHAATQTGSSAPLVKQELRQRILLKRHMDGKPDIKPEITPRKEYKLTPAEKAKRDRRRDQNKRAAQRCRDKKRVEERAVKEKYGQTKKENEQLHSLVDGLQRYLEAMQKWLIVHTTVCNVRLPTTSTGQPIRSQLAQKQLHQQLHDVNIPRSGPSSDRTVPDMAMLCASADTLPQLDSDDFDLILDEGNLIAILNDDQNCPTTSVENEAPDPVSHSVHIPATDQPSLHFPSSSAMYPHHDYHRQYGAVDTSPRATNTSTPTPQTQKTATVTSSSTIGGKDVTQESRQPGTPETQQTGQDLDTDPAIPDLPGYPFSTQRKRKSTGSITNQPGNKVRLSAKSATYPKLPETSSSGDAGRSGVAAVNASRPTSSQNSRGFDPDQMISLCYSPRLNCSSAASFPPLNLPSPSPSTCSILLSVTPPPRSAWTPPALPCVTPPPPPAYSSVAPCAPPPCHSLVTPPSTAAAPPLSTTVVPLSSAIYPPSSCAFSFSVTTASSAGASLSATIPCFSSAIAPPLRSPFGAVTTQADASQLIFPPVLNERVSQAQPPAFQNASIPETPLPFQNQGASDLRQLPGQPNIPALAASSGDCEEESQCSSSFSLLDFLQSFGSSSQED